MTDEIRYQSGFGNEFATEAVAGGFAAGAERATEASAGALHGAVQRDAIHRAAGDESADVDVSDSALGDASAVRGDQPRS